MKEITIRLAPQDCSINTLYKVPDLPEGVTEEADVILSLPDKNNHGFNAGPFFLHDGITKLAHNPLVHGIRLAQPDKWRLWVSGWGGPEPDYGVPASKLYIDRGMLDSLFDRTLSAGGTVQSGISTAKLFAAVVSCGLPGAADAFSEWALENTRYLKRHMYGIAELHPWLCEHGFVKPSTYEDILESVGPDSRSYLVSWAQKHGLLEKVEKLKIARSSRPLSMNEARKIWSVSEKSACLELKLRNGIKVPDSIVIPDRIGSKPVVMAEIWLNKEQNINSLVLPKGVRLYHHNIHPAVFRNYSEILYSLDWEAAGCPSELEIPADKTRIAAAAFVSNNGIRRIKGLDHVSVIEHDAFCSMSLSDGYLEIPASVRTVGDHAFQNCGITAFRLGDSLENIGAGAFFGAERIFCSPAVAARIANS